MGRYTGPKNKLSRREGVNLFGDTSKGLERKLSKPPGAQGKARRKRPSDYAVQLREKQKVKRLYGIYERQFRKYFENASKQAGATGETLLELLERRLDNVVYRLGFARTRFQARQFVNHGHINVNGSRVSIPSYSVKLGEVITLREKALKIPDVVDLVEHGPEAMPAWLERHDTTGKVVGMPRREEIDAHITESLIVEHYSR